MRKKYLKWVRGYNSGHHIKLTIRPVRDFVNADLWAAVSMKKLKDHHKTTEDEEPNHRECANYFTGIGEYKGLITKKTTNAMAVLEAVPYPKMSKHQTHEDRWYLYCSKRRAALELIPDEQLKHKKFVRQHTAHLRKIIAPPALNAAIMRAFETGIHPDSQQYDEHMDLDHKCTLKQMHTLIEAVIDYADAREAEGLKLPGSRQLKPKTPCVYWKRGTCTRGDRCPHSHAGPGSCQPRASRAHGAGGAATASAGAAM